MQISSRVGEGLAAVEQRFARCQRARSRYGRIPNQLWQAAAEAADVHGVEQTAARLRLDASKLTRWMNGGHEPDKPPSAPPAPQFVEVGPFTMGQVPECTLELEDAAFSYPFTGSGSDVGGKGRVGVNCRHHGGTE